jgi:hypothetical protein
MVTWVGWPGLSGLGVGEGGGIEHANVRLKSGIAK